MMMVVVMVDTAKTQKGNAFRKEPHALICPIALLYCRKQIQHKTKAFFLLDY